MANYAVINNGKVTNVIVSDSLELANLVVQATDPTGFCVELPSERIVVGFDLLLPGIGWGYIDGEFIPPATPNTIKE